MCGTRGRTRTGTLLRAGDFESPVSTNFTTLAYLRCLAVFLTNRYLALALVACCRDGCIAIEGAIITVTLLASTKILLGRSVYGYFPIPLRLLRNTICLIIERICFDLIISLHNGYASRRFCLSLTQRAYCC